MMRGNSKQQSAKNLNSRSRVFELDVKESVDEIENYFAEDRAGIWKITLKEMRSDKRNLKNEMPHNHPLADPATLEGTRGESCTRKFWYTISRDAKFAGRANENVGLQKRANDQKIW